MPDVWVCYHRRRGEGPQRLVIRGVALKLAKSTARVDMLASGGEPLGEWALVGGSWLLETTTGAYAIEFAEAPITGNRSGPRSQA